MKKIIGFIFLLGIFLFGGFVKVKAISFTEGDFINGEYISKVNGNKTEYLTMRFINDEEGHYVYCLEPFSLFKDGGIYKEKDIVNYSKLSEEVKRKITLIAYYGYGYNNRTDNKWYAITQYMIWKAAGGNDNIYFTDTLNGKRINKYNSEMEEINEDIKKHERTDFIKDYVVDYNATLNVPEIDQTYNVKGDYKATFNNGSMSIKNIKNSGVVYLLKMSTYYNDSVRIYTSNDSQDLIRPGNVTNQAYEFNIKVRLGDVTLNIKNDSSIYTVEADFTNTCYDILNGNNIVDTICTNKSPLKYSIQLPYGNYTVKQSSVGIGYAPNLSTYSFTIDENNENPVVSINNFLIKNDIEIVKYACKDDVCGFEEQANFEVRDKNGNLVETLATNGTGYAKVSLGYGMYKIEQVSGLKDYTLNESYNEYIYDQVTVHKRELFDYFINKNIEDVPVEDSSVPQEEEPKESEKTEEPEKVNDEEIVYEGELPPETGVSFSIKNVFKIIFGNIRVYLRIII